MRLTLKEFNNEYQLYKNDFDLEMMLRATKTTYAKAKRDAERQEEWF